MDDKDLNLDGFDFDAELSKLIESEEEKSLKATSCIDDGVEQICRTIITYPSNSVQLVKTALESCGLDVEPVKAELGLVTVFLENEVMVSSLEMLMDVNDRQLPDSHMDVIMKSCDFVGVHGIVTMTAWLRKVDIEDADLGQIVAKRYVNGQVDECLPPSIVLAAFSQDIEDLLLGNITFEKYSSSKKRGWINRLFREDEE